ncbi:MAG: rRNA maturation RNase YbeY [Lachnospiraceae bacterium]|nr:rRNA maturation RNase YbeY [Lachnospiraceae bacterium]
MTLNTEQEKDYVFEFDNEELFKRIVETVIEEEECPYDVSVYLLLTGDEEIRGINLEQRNIDSPTDVLSFPMWQYDIPGDFSSIREDDDVFDPDTGELILGDIVISIDRMVKQAGEYGHGIRREYAFLIVHSMLHLIGYDHIEEADRLLMEEKQKVIMELLNIPRDEN